MRLKSSIKNTTSSILIQIVTMCIGLVLPRLYLSAFGSEINGLVSSITQFVAYFTIVEAGLASAAISSLYLPLAQKNTLKINQILAAANRFYMKTGYIFSGFIVGLALIYPIFIHTKSLSFIEIGLLIVVTGFSGAFDFFTLAKYRALLTADQKYYIIANVSTITSIVSFILILISIKLSYGIIFVRTVALTTIFLRSLMLNLYVRHSYTSIDYSVDPDNHALDKRWDAFVLQLLGMVQTAMPVILLTIFTKDLIAVSVFSIYNMVAYSIIMVLNAVTNGFSATFGDMIAKKESEIFKQTYLEYEFVFFNIMIWAYACMNILYIPFIRLYTEGITDADYIQPLLAILFVLNGITYNLKTPAGTLIGSAGVFKETKVATIIQTIIAIVLCLIFTPLWGIPGLLIALIISNLYRDIELVLYMSKNITKTNYKETFSRMIRCGFIFILANLPFVFVSLEPISFFMWTVYAVGVSVWCLFVTLVFNAIFDRKMIKGILGRLKLHNKFQRSMR